VILALFEDPGYESLWPLTATAPLYLLKVGPYRLYELWGHALGVNEYALFCRRELEGFIDWLLNRVEGRGVEVNPEQLDDDVVAVNAAYLPLPDAAKVVRELMSVAGNVIAHRGGRPLAIRATRTTASSLAEAMRGVLESELLLSMMEAFEDIPVAGRGEVSSIEGLCSHLEELLAAALESLGRGGVVVEEGARVEEHVVLREPAYVGRGVVVEPYSVIEGSSVEGPSRVGGYLSYTLVSAYSTVYVSRLERTVLAGANVIGPYSSSVGGGARALGFAARLMPSSALLGSSAVGVASLVSGLFEGRLEDGSAYEGGRIRRVTRDEAIGALRHQLSQFGRLPSDYELSFIERALGRSRERAER